ncbi:MAG: 3-phosphoshikimate 1-carboxyvinyltransferase [Thermoproteota archaeon]
MRAQESSSKMRIRGGWNGVVEYYAPPSKSYSHRSILISAVSQGASRIRGLSLCDDVEATLSALRLLGVKITLEDGEATVEGCDFSSPVDVFDCKGSASTLRMLAPLVAARESYAVYTGDASLRRRPVSMLIEAFSSLGIEAYSRGGLPPLTVVSRGFDSDRVTLDASETSQHVSGFLMAGARLGRGFKIILENGVLVSRPYVELTARMLGMHGVETCLSGFEIKVEPGVLKPFNHVVPGDFSLSAIPLALAAASGSRAVISNLVDEPQPDREIVRILSEMGVRVKWSSGALLAESILPLKPCVVDCSNIPDLVPALALAATAADGTTVLRNVGRLEIKESMRARMITEGLSKMGARIFFNGSEITVEGPCRLRGSTVDAGHDHRVEMMLAAAAMLAEGETTVVSAGSVSKSNPGFYEWLTEEGVELEWV